MVEEKTLFEWNSEVALVLHMHLCKWVVLEDNDEDLQSIESDNNDQF